MPLPHLSWEELLGSLVPYPTGVEETQRRALPEEVQERWNELEIRVRRLATTSKIPHVLPHDEKEQTIRTVLALIVQAETVDHMGSLRSRNEEYVMRLLRRETIQVLRSKSRRHFSR